MEHDPHWKIIDNRPYHGISLPLFSIRKKQDLGIGEFLDLIPLISWCKKVNLDLIQLLPINDSGEDPSPYNPISSCALDPIYLSLKELNLPYEPGHFPRVDKAQVWKKKSELLYDYFQKNRDCFEQTESYQQFIQQNNWLISYAKYKSKLDGKDSQFYIFLQYLAFDQMKTVKKHAESEGVLLMGDIPILLSPNSNDVLENPSLFHLEFEAGAPPDYYNSLGQSWGFPLFNWEEMEKNGYSWWKQRLKTAEQFFHIYRIDHIVGFFRIWAIPRGETADKGWFIPADKKLWGPSGEKRLQMFLDTTSMLPIGEDLGLIPKEVYSIMDKLKIGGTKVIRWQRYWEKDQSFIPFDQYNPMSMTTLSTHDMEPLELWWKKCPNEAIPFAHFFQIDYHPILSHKERFQILKKSHHTASKFHINPLQEYLALYPELVYCNPEEERINIPGTFLPSNWTYRFKPTLEDIIEHKNLQTSLENLTC